MGRHLQTTLDRELARARRHGGEFSVVVFEVEGLKGRREDGHAEGESVVRAVGGALAGECRRSDVAARLGESAFALVLPETGAHGAEEAAQRVERAVAEVGPGLTVCHGAVTWPGSGDSQELLLMRAHAILRAAKAHEPEAEDRERPLAGPVRARIDRVLGLARAQLGMDVTFLGELADGREVFHAIDGDGAAFGVEPGTELPLSETYCHRMVNGQIPNVVPDSAAEPRVAHLAVTKTGGIAAYVGAPVHLPDGRLYGALCGVSREARPDLSEREAEQLRLLASFVGELLEHADTDARERRAQLELSGIRALIAALEARDHYTSEHSHTVVGLAVAVARRLGLPPDQVLEVEQVALLHDIGKVGIPDSVLQKRGPLSREEWELMRQHPAVGERILGSTDSLSHLAAAVRAEHERFDGSGYPDGLRGEEIPIASRITLACDAYHAMTSDRPYRAALSREEARYELELHAGTQFDPVVARTLLAVINSG